MAQDAIHLLFDVEGGENLDSGSGKEILRQLTSIVNQINGGSRLPKINIEFDAKSSVEAIKKELSDVLKISKDVLNAGQGVQKSGDWAKPKNSLATYKAEMKELIDLHKQAGDLEVRIEKLRTSSGNGHQIAELTSQYDRTQAEFAKLMGEFHDKIAESAGEVMLEDLDKLSKDFDKITQRVNDNINLINAKKADSSGDDVANQKAQTIAFNHLNDAVREYYSLKKELSKVEKGVAQDGDKWKTEGKEGEAYEKRVARINELIDGLQTLGITSQSASRLVAQSDDEKKKSAESLGISLDQYEKILERVIETERRQGIDAEREASHQYDANAFKEKSAQLKEYFKLLKDLDKYKMKDGTLSGGAGKEFKEFEGQNAYEVRIKLINECREALKELKIEFNDDGVVVKPTPKDIETQAKSLKMSAEEYRALIDLAVKNSREFAVAHEKNSASVQESWTKNAQKAHDYIQRLKDVGAHMNDDGVANLIDEVEKILAGGDTKNLTELQGKVSQLREAVVKSGADIETWAHKVSRALGSQLRSALAGFVTGIISKAIRDVYNNVVALDSATTDLQIATGKTREETAELVKEYSNLAKQLGATTAEVAKSADTWLRQGYSIEQTNTLIRNSTMLAKLGQMESEEAAKALTSAMKGYKVEVKDSIGIVDKFTAVDMEAAVSAGDIATAMAETAASADIAGVSMDRLIGYIATVAEVTQDGAESVGKEIAQQYGNILKVGNNIGQRLGTVKTEVTLCNKKSAA